MTRIAQEGKPPQLTTQQHIANTHAGVGHGAKPLKEGLFGETDGACK
jgi:hypothetical protein